MLFLGAQTNTCKGHVICYSICNVMSMWSLRWHFTNKSVAGAPYSIKGYSYSLSHETTHHQLPEAWSKYLHNVFHVAWWWRRGDWYIDVNECELGDPCPGQRNNMTCRNTPGSFSCSCPHGFRFNPRSRHCEGIPDEKDLTGLSQFTQFTSRKLAQVPHAVFDFLCEIIAMDTLTIRYDTTSFTLLISSLMVYPICGWQSKTVRFSLTSRAILECFYPRDAMAPCLCLSVCLSVCHKPVLYRKGWME